MSDYQEFENKMKKTCEALGSQLESIRAGRANAAVLNQIEVDYYGSPPVVPSFHRRARVLYSPAGPAQRR